MAYLPVKGERFHFAIIIDDAAGEATGSFSEPYSSVSFSASSEMMDLPDLKSLCSLQPTEAWAKGEMSTPFQGAHNFSSLSFESNREPDSFENKLEQLLDFIEKDADGITNLVRVAVARIRAVIVYHNYNGMLGGPSISTATMNRISALNLEIDFDLYAEGKSFL